MGKAPLGDEGGHLRQNVVTGRWALVAPGREGRPVDGGPSEPRPSIPDRHPDCPFCPGNEEQLWGILAETPGAGGEPWGTRVVPNRFPAITTMDSERAPLSLLPTALDLPVIAGVGRPAVGRHEVIVESPRHDRDLSGMSTAEIEGLIHVYRERFRVHRSEHGGAIVLFRNRGRPAGASLHHPHTQLVAMETVPPRFRTRARRAADWYARHGSCLMCDLPGAEPGWEERVIHDEGDLLAFVPWAPEASLEVWILPRRHVPEFGDISAEEVSELGRTLRRVLTALSREDPDHSYNMIIHSASADSEEGHANHWFARIVPRSSRIAGFELATGVHIVPTLPESDASRLRMNLAALDAGMEG